MSLIKKTRESSTMQLVFPAVIVLMLKFSFAGVEFQGFGIDLKLPEMGAEAFGIAFGLIMAVWLQREWRSAKFKEDA